MRACELIAGPLHPLLIQNSATAKADSRRHAFAPQCPKSPDTDRAGYLPRVFGKSFFNLKMPTTQFQVARYKDILLPEIKGSHFVLVFPDDLAGGDIHQFKCTQVIGGGRIR